MANALYQRRQEFFKESANGSPTATSPTVRATPPVPEKLQQVNGGENHYGSSPNRPSSPNGGNYAQPVSTKKYNGGGVKILQDTVGFANIPNQVFRKAVKQGFEFSLMVVGQSGLGKSTFVNSLFLTDFYASKVTTQGRAMANGGKTLQINEHTVRLVENNVGLTLTLIDTPGFGDAVDNSQCWDPIINYVDRKFADYFKEETKIHRKERIPDSRVHCCLYFIAPTGHGLKQLDIEFMKQLHDRVNIVPIIAKADTMTPEECSAFKKIVAKEIAENKINIYQFPAEAEDSAEDAKERKNYKSRVPFAVVGSNVVHDLGGGRKVRCRKYPWGTVEVENLEHNDFIALRNMIIRSHMIDLVDVTRFVHFENFRIRQFSLKTCDSPAPLNKAPFTQIEDQRREYEIHMKQEEAKREQIFQEKLMEKHDKLKQMEKEVDRHIEQMKEAVEQKRRELEQRRSSFVQDRLTFKQQYPDFQKYISSTSLSDGSSDERGGKKWKTGTLGSVFRSHHKQPDE